MGQSSSSEEFRKNYLPILQSEDSYFGKITIYSSVHSQNDYAFSHVILDGEPNHRRGKLSHPNVIKGLAIQYPESSIIPCSGSNDQLIAYWEFPGLDTLDSKSPIPEPQLWQYISQIIAGCQYLQKAGIPHGNISPTTIFINKGGVVKLAEASLLPAMRSGYQRYFSFDPSVFLAPEQLGCLRKGNANYNPYKADVYSLGVTLLEISTRKATACYDQLTINQKRIEGNYFCCASKKELIEEVPYSNCMKTFLIRLLTEDPIERPTFAQINLSNLQSVMKRNASFYENYVFKWQASSLDLILAKTNLPFSQEITIPMIESIIQMHPIHQSANVTPTLRKQSLYAHPQYPQQQFVLSPGKARIVSPTHGSAYDSVGYIYPSLSRDNRQRNAINSLNSIQNFPQSRYGGQLDEEAIERRADRALMMSQGVLEHARHRTIS